MPTGTFKLQSVALPGRYISIFEHRIVGHGVVTEWFAAFDKDKDNLASFQAVRNGELFPQYISFNSETKSLKVSEEPWLFAVTASPSLPSFFSIEVVGIKMVMTLLSYIEGAPIKLQTNTDGTQHLWQFNAAGSAE